MNAAKIISIFNLTGNWMTTSPIKKPMRHKYGSAKARKPIFGVKKYENKD